MDNMSDNTLETMNTDAPAADAATPNVEPAAALPTPQELAADVPQSEAPAEPASTTTAEFAPATATDTPGADVEMSDAAPAAEVAGSSPAPAANLASSNAPSPAPGRNSTPGRAVNGTQEREPASSRANSVHPETGTGTTIPARAANHGDPVRQYLNSKVTNALLEGMKKIAKEQPDDPLRVLGNHLIQRANEAENAGS